MLYYVFNLVYFNCVLSIKVRFVIVVVVIVIVVGVVDPKNIPLKFGQKWVSNS